MNQHLWEEASAELKQDFREMDNTVSRTLTHLLIFPHRKGHAFIRDGVLHLITLFAKGECSGGDLYRCLALWHHCTPRAAESSIRSAIKAAENMGATERLNQLFGMPVSDKSCPLSNLQFISLLAQYCYYFEPRVTSHIPPSAPSTCPVM